MRNYTSEPITDEDLSTILYAAYGLREDGKHTVVGMNGVNAAIIYVIRKDGAYKYNPENHSLILYKEEDYREVWDLILTKYKTIGVKKCQMKYPTFYDQRKPSYIPYEYNPLMCLNSCLVA